MRLPAARADRPIGSGRERLAEGEVPAADQRVRKVEIAGVVREIHSDRNGGATVVLDVWVRDGTGNLATIGWASGKLTAGERALTGGGRDLPAPT